MTFEQVWERLRSLGSEQVRKTFLRHGAGDSQFGVRFADLEKLRKQIKSDHELARKLWASGNVDARHLATMVADPKRFSLADAEAWIGEARYYMVVDLLMLNVVAKTPWAKEKLREWCGATEEIKGRAGWSLVSALCRAKVPFQDAEAERLLGMIEAGIHKAPNRKREAMNDALIALSGVSDRIKSLALNSARRIGKVEIDHGDTDCKTRDATEYINKMAARNKAAGKSPAKSAKAAKSAKPKAAAKTAAKAAVKSAAGSAKPASKPAAKSVKKAAAKPAIKKAAGTPAKKKTAVAAKPAARAKK